MSSASLAIPILHAVSNDDIVRRGDFVASAIGIMRAGGPRVAVHVRSGTLTGRELFHLTELLVAQQEATGAWVVVNGRPDIAVAARARGAQLTSRSLTVAEARIAAPAIALVASVHVLAEALVAARDGADWLVAGHVFDTPSHEGTPGRGLALIDEIASQTSAPVIAIGGVLPAHMGTLRAHGAYGAAAIRGIWRDRAEHAERATGEYLSEYDARPRAPGDDRAHDQR
jgi:thiazole tautomerase (transcriptional regulator TenI)